MKKFTVTMIMISLLAVFTLSGCSEAVTFDLKEIGNTLGTEITFQDELTRLDKEDTLALYDLSEDDVADCLSYVSSGATAEEIGVFQGNNKNSTEEIIAKIETRITNQKEGYRDYNPTEVPKLENYVLKSNGNYVVVCISDDNAKAEEILKSLSF